MTDTTKTSEGRRRTTQHARGLLLRWVPALIGLFVLGLIAGWTAP